MRILFLTQVIPWPLDAGPKIKTWNVLRFLKEQGHSVILVSFVREEEKKHVSQLEQLCKEIYTVPLQRSRMADALFWLRGQFSGRPFLIERDDLSEMRARVSRLLAEKEIEVLYADQLSMVQFGFSLQGNRMENSRRPFLIFDAHNAVWTIVERMGQNAPWFLKPILAQEARKIKRYEGQVIQQVDRTLAVSEIDRQALLEAASCSRASITPIPITVIPIAVDTSAIRPVQRKPRSTNILTLGTLHYPPNADGIRWFMREVFPLISEQIPSATLTIVGKNPPGDFIQMAAKNSKITVSGYVPDLTPFFERAAVVVIPVRAGGGMRVRILEAFARGVPIVTTTVGLEGIEATVGKDVIVADTSQAFAVAVEKLLGDPAEQNRLARNCRLVAESQYDWRVVLNKLSDVLSSANCRQPEPIELSPSI